MITKYYDADCNLGLLDGKTVAIMGYGSQGHAHAQNLKESGVNVIVGLRSTSSSVAQAEAAGLTVMEVEEAAKAADIVMMLVPDEVAADIYNNQVAPYMKEGDVLMFAHGFNIHFNCIVPQKDMQNAMKKIGEALNWCVFNGHEKMMRNTHASEDTMRELFELERRLAENINDGLITNFDQAINFLRKRYSNKYYPKVFNS